jgi:6-phosphogluconolactonase (cycloisomerase 2 family)
MVLHHGSSFLKFSQESGMVQKALAAIFVFACIAGGMGCEKNGSHYVYATVPAASQLVVFREDPYSGVLTQLSESPYTVGSGAQSVVVHPSNKFLYVANPGQDENDVSLFDINSDGTVTEVTPRTVVGTLPNVLVIDPSGNYLYVANVRSNNISVFSITSGTGVLTPVPGSPFNSLTPTNMVVAPSGKFLYVTAPGQNEGFIEVFSVTAGALTALQNPTLTSDNSPTSLAINPAGTFLYVANTTSSSISVFSIAANGTLAEIAGSPLADNYKSPVGLTIDPTGSYLYVANQGSNNIATFSITSATGFPVAITDSPFASETEPSFLAADPNGAASGSLNSIATYRVGNTVTSIAVAQ